MIHTVDLHFQGKLSTIASFVVETSEGPVLVETGPHSCFRALEKGLSRLGHDVSEVRHVFITHIHLDHAGAAWCFAQRGATIWLHPIGKPHLADPSKLMQSARMIYGEAMDRLWGRMEPIEASRLIAVEDGETITVGETAFRAWHTPGHARHHIAWQLGDDLFTGDVAGVKLGEGPVEAPCPAPDIDLEAWRDALARLRLLSAKRFHLTHFGTVEGAPAHLAACEAGFTGWADWVKRGLDAGRDSGKLEADFRAYVDAERRQAGLDEAGMAAYEAANPAFMSVAGLARYWRKKAERELS